MNARASVITIPIHETLALIRTLGRMLDDLERDRIATTNRIGALERERGEALPHLYAIVEPIKRAEHIAELELVRAWRKHLLAAWAKTYRGLGEKSIARLIAEIGDPSIGSVGHWEISDDGERKQRTWIIDGYYDRTVSQLRQYCGVGDPARIKIPKGATQVELMKRGKPLAHKQVWLIAVSMLKTGNREYYDTAHAAWAARETSDGHKRNHALRVTGKNFLRDLWVADRALHPRNEPHLMNGGAA